MEIGDLFSAVRYVGSKLSVSLEQKPLQSVLSKFHAPMILEDNKERAKRVTKSSEKAEESEKPEYIFDDIWKGKTETLPVSEEKSAEIPEKWEDYSNLVPEYIKRRAKYCRDFLQKRLSITKEQASGIVGVLISETNLNPASYNKGEKKAGRSYGAGIGSWTSEKIKDRIKKSLIDISGEDKGEIENYNLDEQLEAYARDLESHSTIFNKLKGKTTVEDAAFLVTRGIENGGMTGAEISDSQFNSGYKWIKGEDKNGVTYDKPLDAAMYNMNPKYALGRIITSRLTYTL